MNHLGQDRITALEKKLLLIIYSADQPATQQFSNLLIFILQESYHEYFAALWKTVNQEFKPGRLSETVLWTYGVREWMELGINVCFNKWLLKESFLPYYQAGPSRVRMTWLISHAPPRKHKEPRERLLATGLLWCQFQQSDNNLEVLLICAIPQRALHNMSVLGLDRIPVTRFTFYFDSGNP